MKCENCDGMGTISYNPNLNPNSFHGIAIAKCTNCSGTGIEEDNLKAEAYFKEGGMADSNAPIKINIASVSVERIIEFWLKDMLFRQEVRVSNISFNERDHFTIEFIREPKTSGGLTSGE